LKELQRDVHRAVQTRELQKGKVQREEVQKEGADQDSVLHVWYFETWRFFLIFVLLSRRTTSIFSMLSLTVREERNRSIATERLVYTVERIWFELAYAIDKQ
jgi:hypothetical protein